MWFTDNIIIFFSFILWLLLHQFYPFMMQCQVYSPFDFLKHYQLQVHFLSPHKQPFIVIEYFTVFELVQVLLIPFLQPFIHAQVSFVLHGGLYLQFIDECELISPLDLFVSSLRLLSADSLSFISRSYSWGILIISGYAWNPFDLFFLISHCQHDS